MNHRTICRFGNQARELFVSKLKTRIEEEPLIKHVRLANRKMKPIQSVFIPFIDDSGSGRILLTKRSNLLRAHRGEICFPGGKCEANESMEQTALREMEEEIGINNIDVDVWGEMDPLFVTAKAAVTPIVGIIKDNDVLNRLKVNEDEVHIVMSLPINEICTTVGYTRFKDTKLNLKMRFPVFRSTNAKVYFQSEKAYVPPEVHLWGLSACMLDIALTTIVPGYQSQLALGWN